jgi:hypothetical protein
MAGEEEEEEEEEEMSASPIRSELNAILIQSGSHERLVLASACWRRYLITC